LTIFPVFARVTISVEFWKTDLELGQKMQNSTIAASAEPTNRLAAAANRILSGEVAGIPVAIVACAVAAAILGGIVAITAGA
jgi:hypothetical protein